MEYFYAPIVAVQIAVSKMIAKLRKRIVRNWFGVFQTLERKCTVKDIDVGCMSWRIAIGLILMTIGGGGGQTSFVTD